VAAQSEKGALKWEIHGKGKSRTVELEIQSAAEACGHIHHKSQGKEKGIYSKILGRNAKITFYGSSFEKEGSGRAEGGWECENWKHRYTVVTGGECTQDRLLKASGKGISAKE